MTKCFEYFSLVQHHTPCDQGFWNQAKLTFLDWSILIGKNFYCSQLLRKGRCNFCKAKRLGIMNVKLMPTDCFPIELMQVSLFKFYNKISRRVWKNDRFVRIVLSILSPKICKFISIPHIMFLLFHCLIAWWWLKMKVWLLSNVSNKEK